MATQLALKLGYVGYDINIILSAGEDWKVEIEPDDPADLVDGTEVVVDIYPPGTEEVELEQWPEPLFSWPATVAGGLISWKVIPDEQEQVPHKAYARMIISIPNADNGMDHFVWGKGPVIRDD